MGFAHKINGVRITITAIATRMALLFFAGIRKFPHIEQVVR